MATRKPVRPSTSARALDPSPRHLWLASLGLLVAARRESRAVSRRAMLRVEQALADARHALRRADADVRSGVAGVQRFGGEVEARLAPIVAKLGLAPRPRRAPRKAAKARRAPRKPPVRRAAR
jgi:hypothetical protein